jgi:hypothetical protein
MHLFRSLRLFWLALALVAAPAASFAQIAVGVSIRIAPPVLPVYVQPPIPGPGYLWAPGYWAYGPAGYYWVPGTWVMPPTAGLLWTPGYWGWNGGVYAWNAGYWAPHVGFYGGVNYGFGYGGIGFAGGFWNHGVFNYNRSVTNVGGAKLVTYNKTVIITHNAGHASFNGGPGGIAARPTPQEEAAGREPHSPATGLQAQHENAAAGNHALLASVNHGRPAVAATSRAGAFSGQGIVAARAIKPPGPAHAPQAPHGERLQPERARGEEHHDEHRDEQHE